METTTRIGRAWLGRVAEPTMTEGHIRQYRLHVWAKANGYPAGGAESNITEEEAREVVAILEARIASGDAPRVTEEQAEKGRRWLETTGRRYGAPDLPYREIAYFTLEGVYCIEANGWRTITAPIYRAHFPDGSTFRYWATPWMADSEVWFDEVVTV